MERTLINPPASRQFYEKFHFSQGVRVGDTIWLSGQVGLDENLKPAVGIGAQARIAFENVKELLAHAGASLGDVVELMTFHTDFRGEIAAFASVKDAYFPKDYPCWTAVGVTQLAMPGLCVEIRVIAIVGSSTSKAPVE
jgi:enamine deaminase RidA (YjgF/YER057c/UK114 family)